MGAKPYEELPDKPKLAAPKPAAPKRRAEREPVPPGSRQVKIARLGEAQTALAVAALAVGPPTDKFGGGWVDNVPIFRGEYIPPPEDAPPNTRGRSTGLACLRPHIWLHDDVINASFHLLDARSQAAIDATLPKCHFMETNFYTKLAEGASGYSFASVRRWTRKVDVFTKDMIMVPIHCHGNHWTLALINLKAKRFEYYDSLRGSADRVLEHLRQWLEDEHEDKKKAPYDTSGWTDIVWKSGTPEQENGCDCGVFLVCTADYLARDARLDFTKADMEHYRHRMVYQLIQQQMLP